MNILFASQTLDSIEVRTQLFSMIENQCKPSMLVIVNADFHKKIQQENKTTFKKKVVKKIISLLVGPIRYPSYKSTRSLNSTVLAGVGLNAEQNKVVDAFIASVQTIKMNEGVNSTQFMSIVKKQNPEMMVATMCGLIKKELLSLNIPILNVHTSKLPEFKGMNCVEWAIWYGKDIWCTHHRMAPEIDAGDILEQYCLEDNARFTKGVAINELRKLYFHKAFKDFGLTVKKYFGGQLKFKVQPISEKEIDKQFYSMHKIMRDKLQEKIESHYHN